MAITTIRELIEAGVHYGTRSSKWHPRMAPYIFGKRKDVHIIDLKQTAESLVQAHHYAQQLAKSNKSILFVATKRQARDVIRDAARSVGMPYVCERWLGGTLTNNETIRASIRRLDKIEEDMARPDYNVREGKKQQARNARERRRILRNLEGVRSMNKLPDAMFVVDSNKEGTAIREAHRLGIPVMALVDSDCDPTIVNLPIPGNDDGIRSIQAVVKVVIEGLKSGRAQQITKTPKADEKGDAKADVAADDKAEEPKAEAATDAKTEEPKAETAS